MKAAGIHLYHTVLPTRLMLNPLVFFVAFGLWLWVGVEVIETRLPLSLWPKLADPDIPRSNWRFYVGGLIVLSCLIMVFGYYRGRRWPLAFGSYFALAACVFIDIGLVKLLIERSYVWPQVITACIVWVC